MGRLNKLMDAIVGIRIGEIILEALSGFPKTKDRSWRGAPNMHQQYYKKKLFSFDNKFFKNIKLPPMSKNRYSSRNQTGKIIRR